MTSLLKKYEKAEKFRFLRSQMINHQNYQDFFFTYYFEFKKIGFLSHLPVAIGVRINSECNLNCNYCSNKQIHVENNNGSKISPTKFIEFFHWCCKNKIMVHITGGEPFLHNNLFDFIDVFTHYNLPFKIFTNGTLLNESLIKKLKNKVKDNLFAIQVSLNGDNDIQDKISGLKNSFQRIINNIVLLKKYELYVKLNFVVQRLNLSKMLYIADLSNKLNIDDLSYTPIFVTPDNIKLFPNEKKVANNYLKVIERCKNFNYNYNIYQSPIACVSNLRSNEVNALCPAGISTCEVNEYGDVYPCPFLDVKEFRFGNISNESLKSIWMDKKWDLLRKRIHKSSCYVRNCDGICRASSYYAYNSVDFCDIRCKISKKIIKN